MPCKAKSVDDLTHPLPQMHAGRDRRKTTQLSPKERAGLEIAVRFVMTAVIVAGDANVYHYSHVITVPRLIGSSVNWGDSIRIDNLRVSLVWDLEAPVFRSHSIPN